MTAALDEDARLDRRAHDAAKIDAGDRTAGAGRLRAVQRERESRPVEALLEAGRDEADDAGRPALARDDHAAPRSSRPSAASASASAASSVATSICWRSRLSRSSFVGDRARLDDRRGHQQPRAERGVADAPARIDARTDEKAEVIGARRPVGARDVEQRRQTGTLAARASPSRPGRRRRG